jgi:hypothetical protein
MPDGNQKAYCVLPVTEFVCLFTKALEKTAENVSAVGIACVAE